MPLDPQVQAVLEAMAASGAQPFHTQPVAYGREALLALPTMGGEPEPVGTVEDRTIPGPDGPIPVRIYTPEGTGPFPLLVYFHGGGWVAGSIDTHDRIYRCTNFCSTPSPTITRLALLLTRNTLRAFLSRATI